MVRNLKWPIVGSMAWLLAFYMAVAAAAPSPAEPTPEVDRLLRSLKSELLKKYPGAKVEFNSPISWTRGEIPEMPSNLSILAETAKGDLHFSVSDAATGRYSEGWLRHSAWVPAWIAVKRVHPGDRLQRDMFHVQDVNISTGQAHQYRGLILSADSALDGLEARQTILEGQFIVTTAVQRIPDIRRGDSVTINLIGKQMTLSTQGVAVEPAYVNGKIRVITAKSKREFTGNLVARGTVEVSL